MFEAYIKEGVERANEFSENGVAEVQLQAAQYAACVHTEEYEEMDYSDIWDALIAPVVGPLWDLKEYLSENMMAFPHRSLAEAPINDLVREFGETADDLTDSFGHDFDECEGKGAVPLFKKACAELIAAYIQTVGAIGRPAP